MKFIEPSIKEVYKKISNDKELMLMLENENLIYTKNNYNSDLKSEREIEYIIKYNNIEILQSLAEILLNNSEKIKNNSLDILVINKIALKEIADSFKKDIEKFPLYIYKKILYDYKYSYIDNFFQNNKNKFFTDVDYSEILENASLNGFVDALMKEFDKMNYIIGECSEYRDFDKIPYDLINYFSQLLGFERGTINANEENEKKYREIIKNIIDIYRVKGTNYSFDIFFKFLGFNISINEFYFDRRLYYNNLKENLQDTNKKKHETFLTKKNPADNKLNVSINEYVTLKDFSPQYSLKEFDDLVKDYGEKAVLGYSKIDKNGNLYKNKIYKYFKTNVVYYYVSTETGNPSKEQIEVIDKVLKFLTPAYISRDTRAEANLGIKGDNIADNTIFFDKDFSLDKLDETLTEDEEELRKERAQKRYQLRKYFPIMLDSEERISEDDNKFKYVMKGQNSYDNNKEADEFFAQYKVDGLTEDNLDIINNYGYRSRYHNSHNTHQYRKKIPMKYDSSPFTLNKINNIQNKNFNDIKNKLIEIYGEKTKKEINFITELGIEDYLNNSDSDINKMNFHKTLINTLTLISSDNNLDNIKTLYSFKNIEPIKIDEEKNNINIENYINDPNILNKIMVGDYLCFYTENNNIKTYLSYRFGEVPSYKEIYNLSYDVSLTEIGIKVGSELEGIQEKYKIRKNKFEDLLKEANNKKDLNRLNKYYYCGENGLWYLPIKEPRLLDSMSSNNTVVKTNGDILENKEILIIYFKKEDDTISYSLKTDFPTSETFSSPKELLESLNIIVTNNYMFYLENANNKEDELNGLYEYEYLYKNKNSYILSELDKKLYVIDNTYQGYKEVKDPNGYIKYDNGKYYIIELDPYWEGYYEADEKDSLITLNNEHKVLWKAANIYDIDENGKIIPKKISRPIKKFTDEEITTNMEIRKNVIKEIFNSLNSFSIEDINNILNLENFNYKEELLNDIINNENKQYTEIVNYLDNSSMKQYYSKVNYSGVYNNDFSLFYDFISSEDRTSFINDYYYKKILSKWRDDLSDEYKDKDFNTKSKFIINNDNISLKSFEKFNGLSGKIQNNNLLGSYNTNLKFDNVEGNFFFVKKDELRKINNVGYIIIAEPIFDERHSSIKEYYKVENVISEGEYYKISLKDFNFDNQKFSNTGYLQINKYPKKVIDNKTNYIESANDISHKEWYNFGDERDMTINKNFGEVSLLLNNNYYLNEKEIPENAELLNSEETYITLKIV